jgi:hypothetical protein
VTAAALAAVAVSSAFLTVYGINLLYLACQALRLSPPAPPRIAQFVCSEVVVQLPIYNERYVAERAIDAAAQLDWPRNLLEIQVLDDSDDDTPEMVARAVARWRRTGVRIVHLRRPSREGYKAGALALGLERTEAPLVAVFDADFVPQPDFLRLTIPTLTDPRIGFVQARWAHLNEGYSLLTYLQSLMTDFHFLVEHPVRRGRGYLSNFTGSAGVWRRVAIEDAGGWSAATLTEDLDLSYRVQLRGWRAAYIEKVAVPQELPVSANAYRSQQLRWATGSFQCAARLLGPVLRSRLQAKVRFQACMHLLGYVAPLAMLLQIGAYPALVAAKASGHTVPGTRLLLAASLLSLAPAVGMAVAQARRGRDWWLHLPGALVWSILGAGTSLTVVAALFKALRGGGPFERTPKFRIERAGQDWRSKAYVKPAGLFAAAELSAGIAAMTLAVVAIRYGQWLLALYPSLFATGFYYLALTSLVQAMRAVRYELLAVRLRAALPSLVAPALLGGMTFALLTLARLPDPFEDSYQHWLIAANLATAARLEDPLLPMQDSWLPAYHLLAALVLKLVGTWNLGALKAINAGFGLGTLALVYRLAGCRRRGLLAVTLLGLHPVFLLTATTATAEPLLVLALLGALTAALGGRTRLAAALALLACLTGTQAWLWLGCLATVVFAEAVLQLRWREVHSRLAWTGPALAVAVAIQGCFWFASPSVAHTADVAGLAMARGSLATNMLSRDGALFGWFALASVPMVLGAAVGAAIELRDGSRRRLLYAPLLPYLGLTAAIVFAGVYVGSHRQYYPALPGLALLAAAACDRLPRSAALLPGAAALLSLTYLPTVSGLVADHRGLAAAGRAAASMPGGLVTDSPEAAYWSGKSPSAIYGTLELPGSRDPALAWLQGHAIGGLVLEDIDNYRDNRVFSELARGRGQPPFVPVSDSGALTVQGGKQVHLYKLRRPMLPLAEVVGASLTIGQGNWPIRTETTPLAKGAVIARDGIDAAGAGMGLGVPIARFADGWWYPGPDSPLEVALSDDAWTKTFDLNRREIDDGEGRFLRFEPGPSHGRVRVTYWPKPDGLRVEVRPLNWREGLEQVILLNEESAAFDDYADVAGTRWGAAVGNWAPVAGDWARFRSSSIGLEWEVPAPPPGGGFFAGSESHLPAIEVSGLDWQFGPDFVAVHYTIAIGTAASPHGRSPPASTQSSSRISWATAR